ncbi:T9SS type A sorting domain-containing protein [Aureibacter tunicatorum]|uniref:Secretion system C-terminal sorting domain-containing protein n=1 Tax=Aureibacter tunicatorum TaxID=866807 RepID=A0AAE3XM12_9BACT|nr:T9SS type A sorting domain-containing protein [Aureibacter tunicatorum]MDR6238897.1 hypothetical protein [Aureibacter tunicatorum]BDD05176.1 hypothetical protein AUTU_26590 [Aureibacter tunicatorum]
MKKIKLILLLLFATISVKAQEVISSQGGSYSNANANMDFTIGEAIIEMGTDGVYDITQGFHQTVWAVTVLRNDLPDYEVSVYPNPTSDILNIKTSKFRNVTYNLYDLEGRLILQNELEDNLTTIEVRDLISGSYLLTLRDGKQSLKTFKLIKHSK